MRPCASVAGTRCTRCTPDLHLAAKGLGVCDAFAEAPVLLGRVSPDGSDDARFRGEGRDDNDRPIPAPSRAAMAEELWTMAEGAIVLAMPLRPEGRCDAATYAMPSTSRVGRAVAPADDTPTTRALATFRALPEYTKHAADYLAWAKEMESTVTASTWDRHGESDAIVHEVRVAGMRYVWVSAGVTPSIRTRFLLVNAFLVLVPLAGLSFARTYERELLRSEEDGMVAIARTLSAVAASDLDGDQIVYRGALVASVGAAARDLKAQVRILDQNGAPLADTGAEEVPKQTRGRSLVDASPDGASIRSILPEKRALEPWSPAFGSRVPRTARQVDSHGPESARPTFKTAPEVAKALGGASGRYTRVPAEFRGVRLYVAEPVKQGDRVVGVVYVSRTTYPVLVALYRARDGLYRVAALSLLFAVIIPAVLGFTIARPLRQLGQAAGRIARGERGVSLRMKGNDEIAELARAFDKMSHELDARLSYISELSANVSHELKTPLASIRCSAELLRDGAADDPAARDRFLGHILGDTERMTRLVSRLLGLSM